MLEIEGLTVTYGLVRALSDVTLRVGGGQHHRRPRCERRRQDDAAAHDQRADPADARAGSPRSARTSPGCRPIAIARSGIAHVPEGGGVIPELTVEENLRLGALWRPDRADRAAALARGARAVPAAGRRLGKPAGDAVRRRAADAGHRPRADGPATDAAAGRAVARPGAAGRRQDHGRTPRPARGHRPDRACSSSRTPAARCPSRTTDSCWALGEVVAVERRGRAAGRRAAPRRLSRPATEGRPDDDLPRT